METLQYAKEQLDYYIARMTGAAHKIVLEVDASVFDDGEAFNPELDDAYILKVRAAKGRILGANQRSVLAGVYKLLELCGCCFFMPGENGEYIPGTKTAQINADLHHRANLRHRGICIEGAVSLENALDLIRWLPKAGFNAYFIQFRNGHTFFERWYTHEGNEQLKPLPYTQSDSTRNTRLIFEEAKRCGLVTHGVGHGWTCESLGYPSIGWHTVSSEDIKPEIRQYLAEVKGARAFFEDIPLNTQLCYSNPTVRSMLADQVVNYISENGHLDIVHFWLGDNFNNMCECERCKARMPVDWYVRILNEIDEKLTRAGLSARIVFLIYFELMWTPETERIMNPDRFILMFAPITRSYTDTISNSDPAEYPPVPPYVHNQIRLPSDVAANLSFLREWKRVFSGDSFDFDYHLMWDIYRDYSNLRLAKVIYDDIRGLKKIGLNGLVSCQMQRAFFPNGFANYVMGHALSDGDCSFEELCEAYYKGAYGDDYRLALDFVEHIRDGFRQEYMRAEVPLVNDEAAHRFDACLRYIRTARRGLWEARRRSDPARQTMWHILYVSSFIYERLAEIFQLKASGGDMRDCKRLFESCRQFVCGLEAELQPYLDVMYFNRISQGNVEIEEAFA